MVVERVNEILERQPILSEGGCDPRGERGSR